jgi:hypothetical protein
MTCSSLVFVLRDSSLDAERAMSDRDRDGGKEMRNDATRVTSRDQKGTLLLAWCSFLFLAMIILLLVCLLLGLPGSSWAQSVSTSASPDVGICVTDGCVGTPACPASSSSSSSSSSSFAQGANAFHSCLCNDQFLSRYESCRLCNSQPDLDLGALDQANAYCGYLEDDVNYLNGTGDYDQFKQHVRVLFTRIE